MLFTLCVYCVCCSYFCYCPGFRFPLSLLLFLLVTSVPVASVTGAAPVAAPASAAVTTAPLAPAFSNKRWPRPFPSFPGKMSLEERNAKLRAYVRKIVQNQFASLDPKVFRNWKGPDYKKFCDWLHENYSVPTFFGDCMFSQIMHLRRKALANM